METTTTTTPPPPPYNPPRKLQESVSFAIEKNDLLAMRLLQSGDECRFVLNGVHFECNPDGRVLMIATNGRFMGILRPKVMQVEPVTETVEFTVNYPMVKYLPKGGGPLHGQLLAGQVVLHYDGPKQKISFRSGDEEITCDEILGNYPKWRQVVPTTPFAPFDVSINARYVWQFERVAKLLDNRRDRGDGVIIKGHAVDPNEKDVPMPRYSLFVPGLVDKQFYGIIMPMHAPPIAMPDWLGEWPPPPPAPPPPPNLPKPPEYKIQEMKQEAPPIIPISEQAKTLGTPPPFYIPRHTVTTKAQARKERKDARTIHKRNTGTRKNLDRAHRRRRRKASRDRKVHPARARRFDRQDPKPTQRRARRARPVNLESKHK